MTSPACRRVPSRTRWWWTDETASSAGIGDPLGADVAVGEDQDVRRRRRAPRRPRAQMRSSARVESRRRPRSTGQVMSIVCALKIDESTWRRLSSSRLRRIGWSIASWWACSGVSPSRLRSEPTLVADAHHDRLARRVDRRVRHLREELLEVASRGAAAGRRARRARGRSPSSRSAPRRSARAARGSRCMSSCV